MYVPLGATYLGDGKCRFNVWAPFAGSVQVHILSLDEKLLELRKDERGYHSAIAEAEPGALYMYGLDDELDLPDPASRYQPDGVLGPSQIVSDSFDWEDGDWRGVRMQDYVLYEFHLGTFSPEGTFEGVIPYLDYLKALGVTAIEIMPVAQFPGKRNWGYDGVYPYAAQNSYGGPEGLKRLAHACHKQGLAVVLDVVYNHLGPDGNCLDQFGPYFTERYRTPWGKALNFDGAHSDEVRRFFIENALYWLNDCHIDGFRLDSVDDILDLSVTHFLEELAGAVRTRASELKRVVNIIAESDRNGTSRWSIRTTAVRWTSQSAPNYCTV
jgi:maltooligosyltrehalose trehalohydrolase